jgi:alkaline phosphatase D
LPLPHARLDRLRFAVAGCQHYEHGYYTAWRGIAEEPVDFVFHYGDYIYETNEKGDNEITYLGNTYPRARRHSTPEPYSLDDYRLRHAQYKSDRDLQAAHAAHPFWMSIDDHDVDNDWAGQWDQDGTPRKPSCCAGLRRFRPITSTCPCGLPHCPTAPHADVPVGALWRSRQCFRARHAAVSHRSGLWRPHGTLGPGLLRTAKRDDGRRAGSLAL